MMGSNIKKAAYSALLTSLNTQGDRKEFKFAKTQRTDWALFQSDLNIIIKNNPNLFLDKDPYNKGSYKFIWYKDHPCVVFVELAFNIYIQTKNYRSFYDKE